MFDRKHHKITAFIALLLIVACASASANETIVMDNGDRLNGHVVAMSDGVLEFETGYAGKIKIDWKHVREISSEGSFEVLRANKEITAVKVLRQEGGHLLLDGRSEPAGEILKVKPADWETGRASWIGGEIDAAVKLERGNTRENRTDVRGRLEWKKTRHRVRLGGELEYGRTDGTVSSNRWSVETSYDTTVSKRFYYGARTSLRSDELADLNHRWTAGPHLGYRLIDTHRSKLHVETGFDYASENYRMRDEGRFLAESWRIEFNHFLVPDKLELYHRDSGLVSMGSIGGVSFESWNGMKLPIAGGLHTSAEIKTSYNGDAPPEATMWDVVYRLKIGYQW
jgi:hypothetical protein